MAEAPAQIVGFGTGSTSYDAFLEREGIPVVRELWVKNVLELPLAHWKRKGGRGTYINLIEGSCNRIYPAMLAPFPRRFAIPRDFSPAAPTWSLT